MAAAQGEQDDGQNHDGHAEGEGPGGDVEEFDADEEEGVVGGAEGGEQEGGGGELPSAGAEGGGDAEAEGHRE